MPLARIYAHTIPVAVVALSLQLASARLGVAAAPPAPYNEAGRYELLDAWKEVHGLGADAVQVEKYKLRDRSTGKGVVIEVGGIGKRAAAPVSKVHPNLRKRFEQARAAETDTAQSVILWLNEPAAVGKRVREVWTDQVEAAEYGAEGASSMTRKVLTQALASFRGYARTAQARREIIREEYTTLARRFIDAERIPASKVEYRFQYGPGVVLRLTEAECRELEKSEWVRYMFADEEAQKELDEIVPASQGVGVWNAGYTGAGVSVAHIEPEPGRMETSNPYLDAVVYRPGGAVDSHATGIGGIIAGQKEGARGIAYGCTLLSANASSTAESKLGEAVDWAIAQGASILNLSYGLKTSADGALHWSDIYFDYLVHNARVLFTKSAGNQGVGTGIVTSPGRGYNSLAVGNIDGKNSVSWDDDEMRTSSSFADPVTGGEKPELAAYGSSVDSTSLNPPWMNNIGSGTSYAAPLVAGIAALCTEAAPTLVDEPAALKAMLMVSALAHNIEGAARLSEKDGAGGAKATAVHAGHYAMTLTEADFDTNGWYEIPVDIPIDSGEQKRVVLTYTHALGSDDAAPDPGSYDRCDLDMSLTINGNTVATSAYGDQNPFEIIDYFHPAPETARIRLTNFAWDPDVASLRIGLAWASESSVGEGPDEVPFDPTASTILFWVLMLLLLLTPAP